MRSALIATFTLVTTLATQAAGAQQAPAGGYRIFISADMEGIAAAVSAKQFSGAGAEYERYRKVLTGEVLAAIEGARAAGATRFVVADGHGDLQNLVIDELPPDVEVIRGGPRPLSMMEGIEQGKFDGAMFIGYHAGATSVRGVAAHTWVGSRLSDVKINGVSASEGYINAAVAGELGVPILLVSGDDAAVDELTLAVKGAEGVKVKRPIGYSSAHIVAPAKAQEMIRASAARAVGRIAQLKPFRPAGAPTLDLVFNFYRPAELLSWLPIVERTGARSVRYKGESIASLVKFLEFSMEYSPQLEP